ncbi:MAG: MBL fold metallo-hydrolase [Desulfobaccales bacterium]|nr:MBL fold metallo-hydrolase [Desulfobaccales bacterium]
MPAKTDTGPAPETIRGFGPIDFIPGKKGGRYPYCHSLVLKGEETWVVDPAADKDYLRHLAQTRRVSAVFISHYHEDHQKYNYLFPQARFYVPAAEAPAFTSLEGVFHLMGLEDPQFRDYWRKILIKDFRFRPLTNLIPYHPGQRFQNGEIILEIIPSPGHTPGHSCFFFPNQDLIFLADVDLTPFGPWYGDATSDLEAFEATLDHLQQLKASTFITAHEKGVFTYEEAQSGLASFKQAIATRQARLLEMLKTPRTLNQLAAGHFFYGKPKEPPFVYLHIETQMLKKHLDRLLKQGAVRQTPTGYLAV